MPIRMLEQHVAELIAAGEVVERPSSVVKELVENAIDAGAENITVEIERGGISLIRIQDDGSGIAAEDISLAFMRHATSKVQSEADLDAIGTLGFRGEALASIASVAQVELLTKTQQDEYAGVYRIAGGQEEGLETAARPVGTTITVGNLFYNTPARMKFLKKDASEGGFVTEIVTRLAISHPEIAFRYLRDGKQVFATPGDKDLKSAAYAVLGADFARDMLAVESQEKQYGVRGLITLPRSGRASRSMQFFYINGRYIKNRTMMAALEQAYRGTMMHGKFPGGILFLQMPAELVDVNVHPAKTEVRFARESDVFQAVYRACKDALTASFGSHTSLSMPADKPLATVEQPDKCTMKTPTVQITKKNGDTGFVMGQGATQPVGENRIRAYNQMVEQLASESTFAPYEANNPTRTHPGREWQLTVEDTGPERAVEVPTPPIDVLSSVPGKAETGSQVVFGEPETDEIQLRLVGEIFKTYIVAQNGDTMCLIDKHAAHERILYEQLLAARENPAAQQLLAPVPVNLSGEEKNALLQNTAALAAAGIDLDDFGGNAVMVRGVPADVAPDSVEDLVLELAGRLAVNSRDTLNDKTEWVLHSVACRAAVKAGDKTGPEQLLRLAQDILTQKVPPFCPHGRPVVLEITQKEIEKQFGRLG